MENYIPPATLRQILSLRLLIARVGEQESLAWSDSYALIEQGQWALKRLYPRYAAYAGARLATEAAKIIHARTLGQRPAVTLFSLGAELDARVRLPPGPQGSDGDRAAIRYDRFPRRGDRPADKPRVV